MTDSSLAGVTFVNVPVYDSPCVLTERSALKIHSFKLKKGETK